MFGQSILYFFTLFLWINVAQCDDTCEFNSINFKEVVAGIDGKVASSDPLHIDYMQTDTETLKSSLSNVTFAGMKNCDAIHVQCDKSKSTFQYHILCPNLFLTYAFEANGNIDKIIINGHGTDNVKLVDYVIMFEGNYEPIVGADQIARPIVNKHSIETDPRGIITFDLKNLDLKDKERDAASNKYFNDNWRLMEKTYRSPLIDNIMALFMKNFNAYSRSQ